MEKKSKFGIGIDFLLLGETHAIRAETCQGIQKKKSSNATGIG